MSCFATVSKESKKTVTHEEKISKKFSLGEKRGAGKGGISKHKDVNRKRGNVLTSTNVAQTPGRVEGVLQGKEGT